MKILFFDGFCSICNGVVDWSLKHDHRQIVQFASLQGKTAHQKLPQSYLSSIETVIYLRNGKIYERSDAILFLLKDLGGWTSFLSKLRIIPRSFRDFFYKIIARNRYIFFKKREVCRLPTPTEKERLLD